MANIKGCFLSQSKHWATPKKLYEDLDKEFHFDFDPCPYQHEPAPLFGNSDGLSEPWGERTFCNPPYGREIGFWVKKAYDESQKGKLVVLLIPSRTDTKWWHKYIMKAKEGYILTMLQLAHHFHLALLFSVMFRHVLKMRKVNDFNGNDHHKTSLSIVLWGRINNDY